jgi:hypothetical protein
VIFGSSELVSFAVVYISTERREDCGSSIEREWKMVAIMSSVASDYELDIGNLLIFHGRDPPPLSSSMTEEERRQYLEQARVLVQALADALFNMPSTLDKVGRLVNLPHPRMQLPREKLVCAWGL